MKDFGAFFFILVLSGKKMKAKSALLAVLVAFCGCELISPDGDDWIKRSDTLTGSADDTTEVTVYDTTMYVTGVKYPDDYYWQRDTAYGVVERSIVVYRDGEQILEVPVGDEYYVTADSDMHRATGGHLYTDFSTSGETVVCRDGEEIFRYSGREMMRGFMVREGVVHTLGLSRSGTGVTYRQDGELVYENDAAVPVWAADDAVESGGSLYLDNGEVYFTLRDSSCFYSCIGGLATEISKTYRNSKQYVQDYRMADGVACRAWVDNRYAVMSPALSVGYERYYLGNDKESHTSDNLRLVYSDGTYYVKGEHTDTDTGLTEQRLWRKDGTQYGPGADYSVYDFCVEGTSYAYAAAMDGELALIDNNGTQYSVEGRWRLTTRRCLALSGGSLTLALTPIDAGVSPALWVDGEMTELPFNGYLTSVVVEIN